MLATQDVLSFGGGFFDYDNDGWLDLFIANGHVYEEVERVTPEIHYKQINSLFHNEANGKFTGGPDAGGLNSVPPRAPAASPSPISITMATSIVLVANDGDPPHAFPQQRAAQKPFREFQTGRHKIEPRRHRRAHQVTAGGIPKSAKSPVAAAISRKAICAPTSASARHHHLHRRNHLAQRRPPNISKCRCRSLLPGHRRPASAFPAAHQQALTFRLCATAAHSAPLRHLLFPSLFTQTFIKST